MTHYSGRVSNVVYSNGDFRVLRCLLDQGSQTTTTVKGNFRAQNVVVGSWLSFEAKWEQDPKYGKQLSVTKSPVSVPTWTPETAVSALSGNGVSYDVCLKLKNTYQEGLVTALDKGADSLVDAGLDLSLIHI